MGALLELEGQVGDADRDAVAGPQRRALHAPAVHLARRSWTRGRPPSSPPPRGAARRGGGRRSGRSRPRRSRGCGRPPRAGRSGRCAGRRPRAGPGRGRPSARAGATRRRASRPSCGRSRPRTVRRLRRGASSSSGGESSCAWMPNSPRSSRSSVWNSTCGPAREREALLARVLEQVVGQLLAERRLVARELLAVGRREEDAVVVGHVHARDGDHLVLLHLLRQLVRELDRLDAGLEGAPEGPFDESAELRLEVAQNAHSVRRVDLCGGHGLGAPAAGGGADCEIATAATAPTSAPATAPRACSSTAPPAVRSPTAASAAIRPAAQSARGRRSRSRASGRAAAAGAPPRTRPRPRAAVVCGRGQDRPDHVLRGLRERALPARRGRHRVGHAEQERLAGQRLRAEEPDSPAAASPARRQAVGASAARPTKAGASAEHAQQRRRHRERPEEAGAREQDRHGQRLPRAPRARCRGGPPAVASQPHSASAEAIQPIRGSRAVATAPAAAASGADSGSASPRKTSPGEQQAAERRPGEGAGRYPAAHRRRLAVWPARAAEHAEPGRRVEPRRDSGLLVEGHHRERGVLGPAPAAPEAPARPRRRQAHAPERGRLHEAALVAELAGGLGQRRAQLGRGRAQLRIGVERGVDRVAELARQVAAARSERGQRAAEAADGRRQAAPSHRVGAGPGLVERQRERVHVARGRDGAALGLLGRHVRERADHVARVA